MNAERIRELLPHRYPFQLLDRVLEISDDGKYIKALKNVTVNEEFFQGHFPQQPVMPGVLIIEALAQATGILAATARDDSKGPALYYFVGIDKARFRKPVVPGDQLILEADWMWIRRGIGRFEATAKVDGEVVASADIMCAQREFDQ